MRKTHQCGVTLVELVVGLLVVGIILSLSYIYMSGLIPRQRLNNEAQKLRDFLILTREFARDRQKVYCLDIERTTGEPVTFQFYEDKGVIFDCPESSVDPAIPKLKLTLDSSVTIPDCSWDSIQGWYQTESKPMFFLGSGKFTFCDTSGCEPDDPATEDIPTMQIILSSSKLPSGRRAREIELQGPTGSIELIPIVESGIGTHKVHNLPMRAAIQAVNYPPSGEPIIDCE